MCACKYFLHKNFYIPFFDQGMRRKSVNVVKMVRVIAPKTAALLIFGVVCCNNDCGECSEMDMGIGTSSVDESSGINSIKTYSDNQIVASNTALSSITSNEFRPPSPAPSLTESIKKTECENYEVEEDELISLPDKIRSGSIDYDGDCERTPNHIYRTIIEEIPKRLSGISNMFSDQLTKIEDELDRYGDYYVYDYDYEEEEGGGGYNLIGTFVEADTPDTFDDDVVSSSHDSLVKTRGGSKSSNCNTLRKVSGHRIKPVKKSLAIIDDFNNSADSFDDAMNEVNKLSDNENQSHLITESPYPRSSRVNSIENEMAVAPEGTIENQIFKEVYPKVSNGPHCKILDGIDRLASEELQKLSKQIGTFIFEHLWHQITQIAPDKPITVTEAYKFFDLLSEIYAQVISIHESSGIRFELSQLIEECLKATLVDHFIKFKPIRDSILLLILNYPNYFDDEFLETIEIYETLRTIVHLSDENEHFDTLEYVRVILSFSNLSELQQYFEILFKKRQRKPSDDLFLPLMEDNLVKSSNSTNESEKSKCYDDKKKMNKFKAKKKTTNIVQRVESNYLRLLINHLIWGNRIVLAFGLILAIIIQCVFLQK